MILLFVAIKVLPLLLLAWIAWSQANSLGQLFLQQAARFSALAHQTVATIGSIATSESSQALDIRAREEIERMTTDTANRIASFLYARDADLRLLASLDPAAGTYRKFLNSQQGQLVHHGQWQLAPDQRSWQPVAQKKQDDPVRFQLSDNARQLHYRAPEKFDLVESRPLYLEVSFIDLNGQEQVKATSSDQVSSELRNVASKRNTYVRAEDYFRHLAALKPGEIYVSNVIGAYVGSSIIGTYTPESAKKAGIDFQPQDSAYAGKENPLGKRFKGLIRWATPYVRDGRIVGYVTMALDHDHLMEFVDHQVPTFERYSDIPDAAAGNYAFIWDHLGRNIAHPRHHSIYGYDPKTGEPVPGWLEDTLYAQWQQSGKPYGEFIRDVPTFSNQGLDKKFSKEQVKQGLLGLDCRYLNFAPQCTGWFDLTSQGGSGSFVILWSGLWKLTTAAAIPYYTGQYGKSPRGFGIVTIGANVDEFHAPANATKAKIDQLIQKSSREMDAMSAEAIGSVHGRMKQAAMDLTISTVIMMVAVILIAIWMASYLTRKITKLIKGIASFRHGNLDFRFNQPVRDEMGELATSFDRMADDISQKMERLEDEVEERQRSEKELLTIKSHLEELVRERTDELLQANTLLQQEISERRLAEQQARHTAEHDPLTGLANRDLFRKNLDIAIEQAQHHNRMIAVLYFDLDGFKKINDTLGHAVGDKLLCTIAQEIQASVRSVDTVARLGGDEFALIVTHIDEPHYAARVAQSILDRLSQPVSVAGNHLAIGTSIGISLLSAGNANAETLLQQADVAMYQAKKEGGDCYRFFEDDMFRIIRERSILERELRVALADKQFRLFYQPRYDFKGSRLVGVEALLRWQHPHRNLLLPGAFLDVAELSNILPDIDQWVLTEVCRQGMKWLEQGFDFGRIAVNVSSADLAQPLFSGNVLQVLNDSGLPPERLEIEITESALIRQYDVAVEHLRELRQHGCHIAIDDFGMEHSSLQRLIECPINVLKIDRFFVSRIGEIKSEAVIAAVVAMAHSIRMDLIAEGVETAAQQEFLETLGCHVVQGYLYARPMPPDSLFAHYHPESSGT